ncbi:hypothetical protein CDD80_6606 [Ophiocordyceps camponoti-rufipedis]|uniref:MYND-type zinc finger protein samB n=1 Tax=Ophiocordyceps camponoti-rufipedis TaxID=2004952 RepID=A0A2C5YJE1_9HYPO|nr:hypothetical protein CDD80_6606 [Ophiocordyceps camponoti-rufipedis]
MREVNFSIPNVNKASVGITTALYDRRALDCTSTLPLINSLNHLAYLTTSSARIRDILTVDGGIERLVCILKHGRSKDMMGMWKWNLAFQCVVNIGVRGTENVRTRVVEADMVPVIATILDNYIKVIDRCREKAEEASQNQIHGHHRRNRTHEHHASPKASPSLSSRISRSELDQRPARRHGPPPIDISASYAGPSNATALPNSTSATAGPPRSFTSTPERPTYTPSHPLHNIRGSSRTATHRPVQSLSTTALTIDGIERWNRSGHDSEQPSSIYSQTDIVSQPNSPTTPLPPPQLHSPPVRPAATVNNPSRPRRRPSIRHQNSMAEHDDLHADSIPSDEPQDADMTGTAESAIGIQDISMEDGENILAGASLQLTNPTVSDTHQDAGAFNITHRGVSADTMMANTANATPVPSIGASPSRTTLVAPARPAGPNAAVPRYLLDRQITPSSQALSAMPREEDVLMSLQLLAYVSKYCGLRSYFQKSHLVPKLGIGKDFESGDEEIESESEYRESPIDEEYLLPNNFNLFPLVEKFTVRYHSTDMQYWAGVVMRNLCRKDDTRGGIRQCAFYQCGKWEEYTRQFAKCRRCRRTKYCSKECQKCAWAFHRHWCVAASQ